MEGPVEVVVEMGVLDDMCMEREEDVGDLHSEMFCTAESPIGYAIGSSRSHLGAYAEIDARGHFWRFVDQVFPDGDDLRTRIYDAHDHRYRVAGSLHLPVH